MSEHEEPKVEAVPEDSQQKPPPRVTSRQMTDAELASEDARGRILAFVSIGIVACLSLSFFFLWRSRRGSGTSIDLADQLLATNANSGSFIASRFFLAIGILLVGAILLHLALAVRSRIPTAPSVLPILCILGPALIAIVLPAVTLIEVGIARDFANGSVKTIERANELQSDTLLSIARYAFAIGSLTYAVAWMIVGVLSVRAGLLTRMVGYVAVAIGIVNVLPWLAGLAIIVTVFWVGAVTIMLLSKGGQKPPAWVLGRPVPWSEVAAKGEEIRSEADAAEAEADGDEPEPEFVNPVPEEDR